MSLYDRPFAQRHDVRRRPSARRNNTPPKYAVSLDFGFLQDYTALALLERVERQEPEIGRAHV